MKEAAETIGVRELRQNASRYLARVKQGQRIAVTDRGELVAYLEPVSEPLTTLQRMIAAGQVRMATGSILDHLDDPLPAEPGEESLSETLQRMRDEEQY
jgi:prevent-host-death family protein